MTAGRPRAPSLRGMNAELKKWREGPAKQAILDFVAACESVPVEENFVYYVQVSSQLGTSGAYTLRID